MIVSNDKTLKLPPIDHRPQTHLNDISNLQKIFKRTLKDPVSRIQKTFNWTKIKPRFLEAKKVPIVDETSKLKEALYNWMQSDNDPNILLNKQTVEYAVLSCLRESNSTLKIQNLEYLSELPDFIFNIPIRELEIYNCNQLTTIPLSSFQLKNLQRLSIRGCSNFEKIPIEIENLSNLLNLELLDLPSLELLNPKIFSLKKLISLHVIKCIQIKQIPKEISALQNLEILRFEGCSALQIIDPAIGFLPKLYYLNLSNCTQITSLPETMRNLNALKTLIAFRCSKLQSLPQGLNFCSKLTHVLLNDCRALSSIPQSWIYLPQNCEVSVENCPLSLTSMADHEKSILQLRKDNSIFGPNLPLSFQKALKSELDLILKIYYWKFTKLFNEKNLKTLNFDFFRFQITPEEKNLMKNFLTGIFNTSEYRDEKTRDHLVKIIFQILAKSASDPSFFHDKVKFLIFAALSSCEDQLLIGLNRIHLELKLHNLSSCKSIEKSCDLLIGYRKLQLLYQEVKALQEVFPKIDSVELFLFLQILLSDCLEFPIETATMTYQLDPTFPINDVTKLIKQKILRKTESKKQIVQFLCTPLEKIYDDSGKILRFGDLTLDNPFFLEISDLWIELLLKFFPQCCDDIQIPDKDLMQAEKLLKYQKIKNQRFAEITFEILNFKNIRP